ncbi:MAG: DUF134 domain-containing protein [Syntrophomonadaceae bacterium]|nr:DUF134 domain-containing protein [Syntrophomonadaceae bacterium]
MSRPVKWRRVCCEPETNVFGPLNRNNFSGEYVIMTVEEYETLRLIDLERFTQEECADRMAVARTTVQRIYNEARQKVARSLVNGAVLRIEGGNYKLCEDAEISSGCPHCHRRRWRRDKDETISPME